ncbi:hypothetical protein [Roseimaritima multifibrata]|nr:hypothetical protein [Roseimaritima multifibrata]
MLAPDLKAAGKSGEVIQLLAKGGKADEVLDFLWRNKGTIVGGAAVSAVLANPDKVLAAGGEYVVKPAVQSTVSSVAAPTTLIASGLGFLLFTGGLFTVAVAAATSDAFRKTLWSLFVTARLAFERAIAK